MILEDNIMQLNALAEILETNLEKTHILKAPDYNTATALLTAHNIHFFLLDVELEMGDPEAKTGIDFGKHIRSLSKYRFTPILYITSIPNQIQVAVNDIHCQNYILKPYTTDELLKAKRDMKLELFKYIANHAGKRFDPDVLTITWARRFADYKRAWLILMDQERLNKLLDGFNRFSGLYLIASALLFARNIKYRNDQTIYTYLIKDKYFIDDKYDKDKYTPFYELNALNYFNNEDVEIFKEFLKYDTNDISEEILNYIKDCKSTKND